MAGWAAKRFWKDVTAEEAEGGWRILLDTRVVKTPAKATLSLPSLALAQQIAEEWRAQEDRVDPLSMPFTRSANAAIDKVATQFGAVVTEIAAYGETDLCCYRADGPETLCRAQADAWDEILDWSRESLGAPLTPVIGVVPAAQPPQSLAVLRSEVAGLDPFALTALHDLVALSGSLLLGLAVIKDLAAAEDLWERSRVDEHFQASQWGVDEEAAQTEAYKRQEFLHAAGFFRLSRPSA